MKISLMRFKKNKIYLGKNDDDTLFIFKVLKFYSKSNNLRMDVLILRDDDTTYNRYKKDSTQTINEGEEPYDCFVHAKEANDVCHLLALVI